MVEIMWHRREIRRQTEKTNINLNIGRNRSTRLKYMEWLMDLKQAYKILEISENATKSEAKQAYRDLVQIWHPDRYSQNERLQNKALEKMKELNAAYDYICIQQDTESFTNANKNNYKNQSSTENIIVCPKCGTKNRSYSPIISPNAICGRCGSHLLRDKQKKQHDDEWGQRILCGDGDCTGIIGPSGKCTRCGKTYEEGIAATREKTERRSQDTRQSQGEKERAFKTKAIWFSAVILFVIVSLFFLFDSSKSTNDKKIRSDNPFIQRPESIAPPPVTTSNRLEVPIELEPVNPKHLKTGTAPFSGRIMSGHSVITVDNGTDTDSVVRIVRLRNGVQQKVRNFYVRAHNKFSAKQIPPGNYILKTAFGVDWNSKERKFNFKNSFSKTETFAVDETTSTEITDDGEVERVKFSNLSITLHKVRHGNFHTQSIDENEFWQ